MATLADWVNGIKARDAAAAGMDPVEAKIMQQYGYLAGFLHEPEIGPILRQAAINGWSKEVLQGALSKTVWWNKWNSTQRDLQILKSTDPASYNEKVSAKTREILQMAQRAGVSFGTLQDATNLAASLLGQPDLDPSTVQAMVFAHAQFTGKTPEGTFGSSMSDIKQQAANFLVPISDQAAFTWAQKIAMGTAAPEGATEYLRNQAKSMYSHLSDDLDRGFTTKELFDPYIQQTAQLLEISPDTIDLTSPKFQQMISTKDADTGKQRAMTLSEAGEYIRRSGDYDSTQSKMNAAAKLTETMAETFGKVKT